MSSLFFLIFRESQKRRSRPTINLEDRGRDCQKLHGEQQAGWRPTFSKEPYIGFDGRKTQIACKEKLESMLYTHLFIGILSFSVIKRLRFSWSREGAIVTEFRYT